jgi:hypothetical protein
VEEKESFLRWICTILSRRCGAKRGCRTSTGQAYTQIGVTGIDVTGIDVTGIDVTSSTV